MFITAPLSWTIGRLLDRVLGHEDHSLFRWGYTLQLLHLITQNCRPIPAQNADAQGQRTVAEGVQVTAVHTCL